jgi:ATP-dependent Clp protease adaptor protein ClpS
LNFHLTAEGSAMNERQPDIVEDIQQATDELTRTPRMFRVYLYNDDFTTKAFVVEILVGVFHKGAAEATELMWRIHHRGRGVAGVYPREIAETKIMTVIEIAREKGFPLKLTLQPDE